MLFMNGFPIPPPIPPPGPCIPGIPIFMPNPMFMPMFIPIPPAELANKTFGLGLEPAPFEMYFLMGLDAASIRSARLPCRSGRPPFAPPPLPPPPPLLPSDESVFLNAYCTVICRLQRNWLCMHSMLISLLSNES